MATWYFKNSVDNNWETLGNWWSNSDGTGSHPPTIPWNGNNDHGNYFSNPTSADNLSVCNGYTGNIVVQEVIGSYEWVPTGTCNISNLTFNFVVYGGNWAGNNIVANYYISGGTFSGNSLTSNFEIQAENGLNIYILTDTLINNGDIMPTVYLGGHTNLVNHGTIRPNAIIYQILYNGIPVNAGYNGVHYTNGFVVNDSYTGFDFDYYLDPSGTIQYCFVNGIEQSPDCTGNCDGSCLGCVPSTTECCIYGCTDASACGYNSGATCDDGSCYWNCNDSGARNYHDGCNSCWYTDCNDSSACNYDENSFGSSECSWGCTDIHARNYHAGCDQCWYVDCYDPSACNYDENSFGSSECTYPDYCRSCDGSCACNDCGAGCDSSYDNCSTCIVNGTGTPCNSACNYGICGCEDSYGCGCNPDASSIPSDVCGFCGGNSYAGCNDGSACNYDYGAGCDDGSCAWNCNDGSARNYHDSCNGCWYTDCNDSTACNYDGNSFGNTECSWGCADEGARNYHDSCNSCWYTDCNDTGAYNYDSNSFGNSECAYGCNDSGARNYHDGLNNACWYVDCNNGGACNYDPNSFNDNECSYPSDGCHNCNGDCTCSDAGCGCNTENDDCGHCVAVGAGCYSGCCGNTCGDYADSDYFGNSCCHSAIGTDSFGRALCDGSYGTCNDPTACGEDIYGCMYTRDTLGICYGDAVLDCAGNPYSPINELELDLTLVDGLFGQMYYNGGDISASFSDGPNAEDPQFFNLHPEYKTLTYTTTEIRNFYVNDEYKIQNLNPTDFTQFGGSNALQQYSWQFVGRFRAPYTDDFSFSTWSDDASYLWLGANALTGYDLNNALVSNGGSHGNQQQSSFPIPLNSGEYYPIRIQFGQGGGGAVLSVAYSSNTETNVTNWSGIAYSYPQCSPDFAINGQCCPSASGSLGSGLVAYWNFDNNLVDHTLNGHNLSGYNGYGYNSGIANSGVYFPDSTNSGMYFPDGSGSFVNNLDITGDQNWSISCWFKFDNIYGNSYPQAIWGFGNAPSIGGDTTLYLNGTGGISLYSNGQGGPSSIIPNTGEWYHSVVSASPTGLNLYINNDLALSLSDESDHSFSGLSISDFLGEGSSGMYTISATVDEMGFWNRELNANEICNLYYSGSGNAFPFTKQPLCYTVIPPSSGMFIPNFITPGLPISPAFNGQFQLSQLMGLPPTIQF